MRRSLPLGIWLTGVWVALWGEVTAANLLGGAVAAGALVALLPPRGGQRHGWPRPLAVARFLVYFLRKLIEASAVVAWEVITPSSRINEGIVAVPIRGVSPAVTTVVANAISLVPGTLTLEAAEEPAVLYVHVLHLRDVEAVRREVRHLELLVFRAFGGVTPRRTG